MKAVSLHITGMLLVSSVSCASREQANVQKPAIEVKEQPTPMLEPAPTLPLKTCREDMTFGPYWHAIDNKEATLKEERWVVRLGASPEPLDEDATAQAFVKEAILRSEALASGLKFVDSDFEGRTVAIGKVSIILDLLKTSCSLGFFDLTGFHCECNPDACAQAKSGCVVSVGRANSHSDIQKEDLAALSKKPRNAVNGCFAQAPREDPEKSIIRRKVLYSPRDARGVVWLGLDLENLKVLSRCD